MQILVTCHTHIYNLIFNLQCQYQKIVSFLLKNSVLSIHYIITATSVTKRQILLWMKETFPSHVKKPKRPCTNEKVTRTLGNKHI